MRLAYEQPLLGQDRVARELRAQRIQVSASGVRYVWQRHGLETLEKRASHIEARQRTDSEALNAEQTQALARASVARRTRERATSRLGEDGGEFSRSRYILAVAARQFRDRGYDATSLRDIAGAAGIPVGSLYYHFPSKDELFGAVYSQAIDLVAERVHVAVAAATEPWERLRVACAAHLRMLCEGDDFAIAPLAAQIAGVEPSVRARLVALNDQYEGIYRALLADLQLPAGVDPTLLRLQILGAVIWTSVWYRAGKATPDAIASHLVHVLRVPLDVAHTHTQR